MSDKLKVSKVESKGYGNIYKLPMLDRDLDVVAKAFYAYLCSFAGQGETAFPGIDKICYDLKVSKSRLERHRKVLIDKGYITVTQVKEKGRFARNEYHINKELRPYTQNEPTENEPTHFEGINNNSINNNNNNKDIKDIVSQDDTYPYERIVDYLNRRVGSRFDWKGKEVQSLIKARFKEGAVAEDFKTVIDKKWKQWHNDAKMVKYLRPKTLFAKSKFNEYLGEAELNIYENKQLINKTTNNAYAAMDMMLNKFEGGFNSETSESTNNRILISENGSTF